MGVATKVGQAMTYWILTSKGTVIARSSVAHLTDAEQRDPVQVKDQEMFMTRLSELKSYDLTLTDSVFIPSELSDDEGSVSDEYSTLEADDYTPDSYDEYLSAQVVLPRGDRMVKGEVVRCHRDSNGRPIGKRNINPILDTREYDVLFPDGTSQMYLKNVIAENLYSQVDEEGRSFLLLDEIVDHEKGDAAVSKDESASVNCHTTKGWKFLVSWKDGTTSYVPLREMKNS